MPEPTGNLPLLQADHQSKAAPAPFWPAQREQGVWRPKGPDAASMISALPGAELI